MRWAIGLIAALTACHANNADMMTFRYRVRVRSDQGLAVPGARVRIGTQSGVTQPDGSFDVEFAGKEGASRMLAIECPNGFESGTISRRLVGQTLLPLTRGPKARAERPEVTVVCRVADITTALVVRTTPGVAVQVDVDDEVVASTNKATGLAHVILRRPRGSAYRVTLKTAQGNIQPQNPTFSMRVGDFDDVVPIEQDFERTHRHSRTSHYRPQRLN